MQMMLRRTCYMNKKRDKKTEIDKMQSIIKLQIEKSLLDQNTIKTLDQLKGNFQLVLTDQQSELVQNFIRDVNEYVTVSN